ncbi:hypothetical protein [Burkholderia sp. ABCPW 111]|uniref:hypothetical protein n=1 Tax=Burkholderia sp. ABCPW 111 TaxID=1820025 RepID=UPI0012E39417|nr:hypothetical protein [Burkholderia sp. ABCPW 111]
MGSALARGFRAHRATNAARRSSSGISRPRSAEGGLPAPPSRNVSILKRGRFAGFADAEDMPRTRAGVNRLRRARMPRAPRRRNCVRVPVAMARGRGAAARRMRACDRALRDARRLASDGGPGVDSPMNQNASRASSREPALRLETLVARTFPGDGSPFALNQRRSVPTRFDDNTPKERPM